MSDEKTYSNDNRGALWTNNARRSDKQDPHYRGNLLLRIPIEDVIDNEDGTVTIHRFIAAWNSSSEKIGKDGNPIGKYLSVSVGQACENTHG